jgi:hypothetical protein
VPSAKINHNFIRKNHIFCIKSQNPMHWAKEVGFYPPLAPSLLHGKIVDIGFADSSRNFCPLCLAEP